MWQGLTSIVTYATSHGTQGNPCEASWQPEPFPAKLDRLERSAAIGVLFGWFALNTEGPGLPAGAIIYQGHLFSKTTYECCVSLPLLPPTALPHGFRGLVFFSSKRC